MLASFKLDSHYTLDTSSSFLDDKKEIIKIGGAILIAAPLLALFPPFAALGLPLLWSISAAGSVISLLASRLKSKDKRERESVEHIYRQLSEQINSWETKTLEDVMKSLNSSFSVTSQSIDEYFECLSDNLEKVSECLDANQKELGIIIQRINFEYANRILEWITGTQQKSSRVQRIFGKQIEIWPSRPISAISDLEKFSQILQEEIIIH